MLLKNVPRFLNVETFSEALVRQHGQKMSKKMSMAMDTFTFLHVRCARELYKNISI